MRKLYVYFIGLTMLVACSSKDTTPPQVTLTRNDLLGTWSGKFTVGTTTPLENGIEWNLDIKNNLDSAIVYYTDGTSSYTSYGTWAIIENKAVIYWKYTSSYIILGSVSNQQKKMTGYFFNNEKPGEKNAFFLDKKK